MKLQVLNFQQDLKRTPSPELFKDLSGTHNLKSTFKLLLLRCVLWYKVSQYTSNSIANNSANIYIYIYIYILFVFTIKTMNDQSKCLGK